MRPQLIRNGHALAFLNESETLCLVLEESLRNGVFLLKVSGEITRCTETVFCDELLAAASVCRILQVDLSEAAAITGAAGEALLRARRLMEARNGALHLTGISPQLSRIWRQSGLLLQLAETGRKSV